MIRKILIILINFILLFSFIYMTSFQSNADGFTVEGTFGGDIDKVEDAANATQKTIATVLSVVRIAAAAVALVIIIVIACKYMLASAGDRADIKKYAMNYVIGAFILFGATALLSIAKEFIDSAFTSS